jgi:phage regulator Rha-like protein
MINPGLFPIDEKFLLAISRLEDENNSNFLIICDKLSEVSTMITQTNLHGFPDYRLNYVERFNFMRGFSAALDLLKNIFNNPNALLIELKEQDDFLEAQERARQEQEGEAG